MISKNFKEVCHIQNAEEFKQSVTYLLQKALIHCHLSQHLSQETIAAINADIAVIVNETFSDMSHFDIDTWKDMRNRDYRLFHRVCERLIREVGEADNLFEGVEILVKQLFNHTRTFLLSRELAAA